MYKLYKVLVYTVLYIISFGIIASTFLLHPIARTPYPIIRTIIIFFATVLLTKYFIYMLLSPIYDIWAANRDKKYHAQIANYRPKVSVVIPAWNEAVGIVKTVTSVLENKYEPLEVVVVNDGSTDDSDMIMREFKEYYDSQAASHPGKSLLYIYKENGGKGRALNTGVKASSGEIIMSIDADCYVTPTAVENFVKVFVDPNVMAAVGNVKIGNTTTFLGTVQYLEFLFSFYFKKADSLLNTIYIIGGAAGAFRREVFDRIGLYHPSHITEDIDFSVRIQAEGMRIVYAADAVVYTEGASELRGLMKQRLRWKRGRFKTFWDNRSLFFNDGDNQNRLLTWGILPLALFGDVQLFWEVFFLLFLYAYSFWTDNFSSFVSGIIVVSSMFFVQIFDDREQRKKIGFFFTAPIGWLLFYISTFVEHNALLESIRGVIKRQDIKWQKWQRKGVQADGFIKNKTLLTGGSIVVGLAAVIGLAFLAHHVNPPLSSSLPIVPPASTSTPTSPSSTSSTVATAPSQPGSTQPVAAPASCELDLNFQPTSGSDKGTGSVNYTLTAKNIGGAVCQSASISVYYDDGETFISSQPAATDGYYWKLGNLDAGQAVTITLATTRSMPLAPGDDTTQACLSANNGSDACANAGEEQSGAASGTNGQLPSSGSPAAPAAATVAVPSLTAFKNVPGNEIGVWQWTPLSQLSQAQMQTIVNNAAASGFTAIYQTVDEYLNIDQMPNGAAKNQALATYDASVNEFLTLAAAKGIAVDAEAGSQDWAESGNTWQPYDIMNFVASYNASHAGAGVAGAGAAKFRGVQYDIEPYLLPNYNTNRPGILEDYVNLVQGLANESKSNGVPLTIIVPDFYASSYGKTPEITIGGQTNYTYNFVLNALAPLSNARIIEMSYVNTANGAGGVTGSIALSQQAIQLADNTPVKVIVAQETGPVSPSYVTFYSLSRDDLFDQTGAIDAAFAGDKSFHGIAVDYLDTYLEL